MRPLLVLILVVAALGAFYLAFSSNDSSNEGPEALSPDAPVATEAPSQTDTALARPEAPASEERVEPEATLVAPREEVRDAFKNRLTGKVIDESGNPVAEAKVVLTKWGRSTFFFTEDDGSWDRSDDRTARTNAEGVYVIDNVPALSGYALVATHKDFASTEVGEVSIEERGEVVEPPIVLRPGRKISGVISDVGGAIVPKARIVLSAPNMGAEDIDGPETKVRESDETGFYEIKNVGPGQYAMTVTADGYGRVLKQKVQVDEESDLELDIELDVAQMIAGRVVSITGEIVPNALVQAFSMPGKGQTSRSQTRSDDNGEFRFEDIPSGSYTIMAQAKGYGNMRKQRIETGTMTLTLELTPKPTINGTTVDALTGEPVPGCKIRVRQPGGQGEVAMPVSADSVKSKGKNAEFTIHPPSPGNFVIEASSPDYATCFSQEFSIAKGQTLDDVVVRLTHGGKIAGRIVDSSGKGVGGVLIETQDTEWTDDQFMRALGDMYPTNATTRQVRSKSNGEFVVPNLTPASYLLHIKHERYSTTTKRNIRVSEGQEAQAGDIAMESGAEVSGTVYGPGGQPLAGSVVTLTMQPLLNEFPEHYTAKTNSKGVYRFAHVRPGTYSIKAVRSAKADADAFVMLEDMKASDRKLDFREGESYKGIDLTLGGGR